MTENQLQLIKIFMAIISVPMVVLPFVFLYNGLKNGAIIISVDKKYLC